MRIGPRKRLALAAAVVTLAVFALVLVIVGEAAALFLVGALQLVTVVGVAAVGVHAARERNRSEGRIVQELRHTVDQARADVDARAEARTEARTEALRDGLVAEIEARASSTSEHLTEHVTAEMSDLRGSLDRVEKALTRQSAAEFAQVEALMALYADVRPRRAFPPTRGWAASPDLLWMCWTLTREERPSLILECGSGVSTLILAYACQRNDHGRVVALDHDEHFAQRTRQLLAEHDLEGWAEVRTAPLEGLPADGPTWYRTSELPQEPIDLVLVDGPPAGKRHEARQPALEVLHDSLSPRATIVVDDYARDGEQAAVASWLERYPELSLEKHRHEKGTAVLRRRLP